MIKYIHSSTLLVNDQDKALDFFVNQLGWEKRDDRSFGDGYRWLVVAPPQSQASIALSLPSDVNKTSDSVGGHTGISLVTDNLQNTYDELSGKGVQFTSPPQQMPWGDMATWFNDPDGNTFFLIQESS